MTMTSVKQNKSDKKSKRPHVVLMLIVAGLVALAYWSSRHDGDKKRPGEKGTAAQAGESSIDQKATPDDALRELGKVVAIGEKLRVLKSKGTTVVGVDEVKGLTALLDGQDVEAVAALIAASGIKTLLIDPSLTPRDPMPKNTVRNRLALGRPAGRLVAKVLSKEYFMYKLGEPPLELPETVKASLISVAREAFEGRDTGSSGRIPNITNAAGEWTVILTVRPVQNSHLSYHTTTQKTLVAAARELGKRARKYYDKRDSFQKKYGPPETAIKDRLTFELEVLYDFGTFIGPRDGLFLWRVIDPGIYGIRMAIDGSQQYMPPWYSVTNNYRTVTSLFERLVHEQGKKPKDYWKRPEVSFDRFRSVHWREKSPGGEVEDLYRASPGMPSTAEVTRENLKKALAGLADWIADNQTKPDGSYLYRYFPTDDTESKEYNMVRHCLGPFSLALAEELVPNPKYKAKAEAGMKFIEDHLRWGGGPRKRDGSIDTVSKTWMNKPLPGPDVAILDYAEPPKGDWSAKMGGVAVSILGYTQYKRVGWTLGPKREKVLNGLANFLLYMQNEKDGSFYHYYVASDSSYYDTKNSIYPGEILYAVARLYGETKDERYREAFKKSMATDLKWFKEQMAKKLPDGTYEEEHRKNLVQFQPWIAMAMDEMYRYDPDPAYVEASNLVSLWIMDTYQFDETRAFFPDYLGGYMKVLDELPAMHTFVYTEGVAASYDLARRSGADQKIIDKLRKGALLAARFLMQQQTRPGENDYYYPNPKKAKGAVRYCMNHNKQRIDYTYHALSSVYRILKAATDEDYAAVQQIPMPKTW